MKLFAITPDNITPGLLRDSLPSLRKRDASYLYIRMSATKLEIQELVAESGAAGIMPIVPYVLYRRNMPGPCGVHFKSSELSLLAQYAPVEAGVITASSHGSVDARLALQAGAKYVFVSPVYAPLSKPADTRQLLSSDDLQKLIAQHGEKIVLLGGMTEQRIQDLRKNLTGDFSIAGISLFFGAPAPAIF